MITICLMVIHDNDDVIDDSDNVIDDNDDIIYGD
jgi:hypothetical protein